MDQTGLLRAKPETDPALNHRLVDLGTRRPHEPHTHGNHKNDCEHENGDAKSAARKAEATRRRWIGDRNRAHLYWTGGVRGVARGSAGAGDCSARRSTSTLPPLRVTSKPSSRAPRQASEKQRPVKS